MVLAGAILSCTSELAVGIDPVKIDDGEDESMLLRRAFRQETISSEIALRLAEMIFVRLYGKEYIDERSPLAVIDSGDRWEVRSREGVTPGERLRMVIRKTNAQILVLANW
jgi:hypothetical protein